MPVTLAPSWLDRFVNELNADELKVYLHLGSVAQARSFAPIPESPRFAGKKGDSVDPAADLKRFKAALGGLKLKDLVELDADGRFRMPYLSSAGAHEADRQVPSAKERVEIWQELERELYGALRHGPSRESFLAVLDLLARFAPRLGDSVTALQREGAEKAAALFEEMAGADRGRAAVTLDDALAAVDKLDAASSQELAEKLVHEKGLPAGLVWDAIAERLAAAPPPGPPALTDDELRAKWEDFVARAFPAYVARPTKVGFLRLLQVAFVFATNPLPAGDPEDLFDGLREGSLERFQDLLEEYLSRARDVVEADAARSVPDGDLLAGQGWEHAKRLAAKHEVPVEVAMDHLMVRLEEAQRKVKSEDFSVETFVPPDISGMSKEEGELAWIGAVAATPQHRDSFNFVLRRLRRAKKGYLGRAIVAYCNSILDLLDEHGMLDNPTDEIIDNICATINEQTAYFRDQYFALTVDPVEPDDVRHVLSELASRKKAEAR